MSFRVPHELHHRRSSRNIGTGLVLAAFICIVFGLTVAKVSTGNFVETQPAQEGSGQ